MFQAVFTAGILRAIVSPRRLVFEVCTINVKKKNGQIVWQFTIEHLFFYLSLCSLF